MKHVLPKSVELYRAWVVNNYLETVTQVGGWFFGLERAEAAIEEYYKTNRPKTAADYDEGAYYEKVEMVLAVNPRA